MSQPNPFQVPGMPPELQEIINTHRALFGGFTMTAGPAEGAPAAGANGQQGTEAPAGQQGAAGQQQSTQGVQNAAQGQDAGQQPGANDQQQQQADDRSIAGLPRWAQDLITGLRQENGAARTNAKAAAADEARKELAQQVGKALGLVKDNEAEVDPAQLQRDLAKAQATNRDRDAELYVWQHATELGVDPQALTDSRAFAAAISELDSSAQDFSAKVHAAAQEAAKTNPRLKAQAPGAQAPGKGGSEFAGGKDGAKAREYGSLADAVSAQYGAGR